MLRRNLFAFVAICSIRLSHGFATTGMFTLVLDVFNDTKFHDTQMSTALCITQFRFLKKFNGLTGNEPAMYADCDYSNWFSSVSDHATATKASLEFQYYVARPDLVNALKNNPTSHFDAESYISGSNYNLILSRQALFASVKTNNGDEDLSQIRQTLGESIHTVQDFYSHTNWVEMGMTAINSRVGEDSYLGVQLNPPNVPACRQCSKEEMNGNERAEVARVQDSLVNSALLKLVGFSYDNVFVCRGNIVSQGLTSGYYGTEQATAPKPLWKCSHGGGTDFTADNTTAVGGINKDSDSVVFSPHYYLHHPAANLSVLATIRYLEDLRLSLNDDDLFGRIIGVSKLYAVGFVIDTTESMNSSINAVRLYITDVIDKAPSRSVFYLTPFNDPSVGPVRRFTDSSDAKTFLYTLMAANGGDTPELAYDAILSTVNAMPIASTVYVFTDAVSKNQQLLPIIQQVSRQKDITITNIITSFTTQQDPSYRPTNGGVQQGQQGQSYGNVNQNTVYRGKREASVPDMSGYKRLNRATGGLFLTPRNGQELQNLSLTHPNNDLETIFYIENVDAGCGDQLLNWTIPVDDTMSSLQVLITTTPGANSSIIDLVSMFTDFLDMKLHPDDMNLLVATSTARMYRFNVTGQPNSYHFYLGKVYCPSGGLFTVNVQTESYLLSNIMFHDSNSDRVLGQPVIGEQYTVYISCSDCGEVKAINFQQCGSNYTLQQSGQIYKARNKDWFYAQNMTIPSTDLICIQFSGLTKKGYPFSRVHRERLTPSPFALSGGVTSNAYPAEARVSRSTNATLRYQLRNLSNSTQQFDVVLSSKRGNRVTPPQTTVNVFPRQTYNGESDIGVRNDDPLDTLTVTAIPRANPEAAVTTSVDLSVVDDVPDTTAPSCHVAASTVASCPRRQSDCSGHSYSVDFAVEDHGAGLNDVRTTDSGGEWSIPAFSQDTSNTQRTLAVSGILSCCEDAQLVVVGKNGLMASCEVNVAKASAAATAASSYLVLLLFCTFHL